MNGLKNTLGLYVEQLLEYLEEDLEDPNFTETPDRMFRTIQETLLPASVVIQELSDILSKAFPSDYSGIVLAQNVKTYSYCPHHLLPVEYTINVGYIPSKETKMVLGVSKLVRVVEVLSKRLVLQETLTTDIVAALRSIAPLGVVVQVTGVHSCMKIRGVKQIAAVKTQCITGVFETNEKTLAELMGMLL